MFVLQGPKNSSDGPKTFIKLPWRDTEYLSVFSPNAGKCGPEKYRVLKRSQNSQKNTPMSANKHQFVTAVL